MTEIEKLILKSLRGTTVMQCHTVKCNPKSGEDWMALVVVELQREWFIQVIWNTGYQWPVQCPQQRTIVHVAPGFLLPRKCVFMLSTGGKWDKERFYWGFWHSYVEVSNCSQGELSLCAGHGLSCAKERGIQSVKDNDKDFEDYQENDLFIWGWREWKMQKFL